MTFIMLPSALLSEGERLNEASAYDVLEDILEETQLRCSCRTRKMCPL